jgi:hypothetical protein
LGKYQKVLSEFPFNIYLEKTYIEKGPPPLPARNRVKKKNK